MAACRLIRMTISPHPRPPILSKAELEDGAALVRQHMLPTSQIVWPLLSEAMGTTVWLKHENHTPTGAFKIRGGITFVDWVRRAHPQVGGVVAATRGNHGQSIARAASAAGLSTKIIVPQGNSADKNAAMRGFGAEVIEHGTTFDLALAEARRIAKDENLYLAPPFHREIVRGVASYGLELFAAAPDLDAVYVPIGCGSGACSVITVRDVLGLKTQVIGVVSTAAPAAKLSFDAGRIIETSSPFTFADGMAVGSPVPEAFEIYSTGLARIVAVSDDEVAAAIRLMFDTTHNVAEGAGAAAVAALMQERGAMQNKQVAAIVCGGNIDRDKLTQVLSGHTPAP